MPKISARHATAAEWLLLVAVVFAISSFLIHEIYSLDVWWQIRYGEDILDTKAVPTTSRYTAAGLGAPYHDSHWLFQVVLALGHRALGLVGVQLVMISLWAVTLLFCYRTCRIWTGVAMSAGATFLLAGAAVERFLVRPELVTYLMIAVFAERLARGRFRSLPDLAVLAVLEVLWVNSHGLFVVGPFLVGCYWLPALHRRLRDGTDRDELIALSRALVVLLAVTPIGPLGFASWSYAALLVSQVGSAAPELFKGIGELSPTLGPAARSAPAFWFFVALVVLAATGVGAAIRRRRVPVARLLQVLGMLAAAMTGRRNIVLFAVLAAPLAAETLAGLMPRAPPRRLWTASAAAVLVAACASCGLSGAYYVMMEIPARWGWGATPSFFPHGFPEKLDAWGFEGQVLNSASLGGFFVYHGFPERLPLVDTCWVAYDEEKLDRVMSAATQHGQWRSLVDEYGIRGLLLAHTSPEARGILPDVSSRAGWRLVYLDTAASFWMPDEATAPPPVDLEGTDGLPVPQRIDDAIILDAFLAAIGAMPQRAVNLERALAFGRREELLLELLGPVQVQLERHEDASRTLRGLLQIDPDNLAALNELAFLAYVRGDLVEAERLMARATAIAPGDVKMRENLQRVRAALAEQGR